MARSRVVRIWIAKRDAEEYSSRHCLRFSVLRYVCFNFLAVEAPVRFQKIIRTGSGRHDRNGDSIQIPFVIESRFFHELRVLRVLRGLRRPRKYLRKEGRRTQRIEIQKKYRVGVSGKLSQHFHPYAERISLSPMPVRKN